MQSKVYPIGTCATSAKPFDHRSENLISSASVDSRTTVVEGQRAKEKAQKQAAPIVAITPERISELQGIARLHPGGHRHVERVEAALRRGPLNSFEALYLGSLHVPARIFQLRERYELSERYVRVLGWDGELHRVREWSLVAEPNRQAREAV